MTQIIPRRALIAALFVGPLAVGTLAGCATQDMTTEDTTALVDSQAAFDTDRPNWETPFWERWANAGTSNAERPDTAGGEAPLANIGLVLDPAIKDGQALIETLYSDAQGQGLRPLPGGLVAETLSSADACQEQTPISDACLASLATYPGVRMLVEVAPAAEGSGLSAKLHDTSLNAHYRIDRFANSEAGAAALMEEINRRVAMAPWSTRAFQGEDGGLYISASRVNGLNQGQQLDVREPGTAVRAPSGQVVAFRPGQSVGQVEIVEFVGDYLAVVKTVSGQTPDSRHWITLPAKQ
ncbi:MAG TPA: hypothetical protein VFX91_01545 [Alcanivorax sp.]|nr:hypothetical protein [Alcanivorax sp.]